MGALENGLSNKLKDALVFTIRSNNMVEYEEQLLALDNRIKAREEEKKGSRNITEQYVAPPTTLCFAPGGLAPMDLSVTQWQNPCSPARPYPSQHHEFINDIKKTSMFERAGGRANNCSDFCGGEGHVYQNCPAKTQHPNPGILCIEQPSLPPLHPPAFATIHLRFRSTPGGFSIDPERNTGPAQGPLTKYPLSVFSLSSVSISDEQLNQNHLVLLGTLSQNDNTISVNTLIDPCASGFAFIDEAFVRRHTIATFALKTPCHLEVINGRPIQSGTITQVAHLNLEINGHKEKLPFFVTKLGHYPIVLGIP
jgi:hypothetical protein